MIEIISARAGTVSDDIKRLISGYRYNDLRSYGEINKEHQEACLLKQISDPAGCKNNRILLAKVNDTARALASLSLLEWDTGHFGIKMGGIGHIISADNYEKESEIKDGLLSFLLDICREERFRHLSCKIDVEDLSGIHILKKNGFKIMDTIVTFVFKPKKHKIPSLRTIYKVRRYKDEDLASLMEIAGRSFSQDRFHLDPFIPKDRADSLYSEWIKNNSRADTVFVALKADKPVGFFTHRPCKYLQGISDYRIMGEGALMAVAPYAKGAIVGLMKSMLEDVTLNYDCVECPTRLSNREAIRLFQRFNLDFIRAKHTLHKCL